jgi:hypothetical protein
VLRATRTSKRNGGHFGILLTTHGWSLPSHGWDADGLARPCTRTDNPLERFNRELNEAFPRAHPSTKDIIDVLSNISIVDINRLQVTATGRRTRPTPKTIKMPAKQVFSGHPIVVSDDESSEPDDDIYTVNDDYGSGGGGGGDNDSDGVDGDDEDNGDSESVDGGGDASESDDVSEAKSADYGVDGYIFD